MFASYNYTGKPGMDQNATGTVAEWGTSIVDGDIHCITAGAYQSGGSYVNWIDVDDDGTSAVTASASGSPTWGMGVLGLFSDASHTEPTAGRVFFVAESFVQPTSGQLKAMCQYEQKFKPSMSCP